MNNCHVMIWYFQIFDALAPTLVKNTLKPRNDTHKTMYYIF